jgi:hypothetical protein
MKGFNYTGTIAAPGTEFDLPVATLKEDLQSIIANGGRRRAESDSIGPVTYAHGSDSLIVWEAYGNIALKNDQQSILAEK